MWFIDVYTLSADFYFKVNRPVKPNFSVDRFSRSRWMRIGRSTKSANHRANSNFETKPRNQFRRLIQMGIRNWQWNRCRGARILKECWRTRPRSTGKLNRKKEMSENIREMWLLLTYSMPIINYECLSKHSMVINFQ